MADIYIEKTIFVRDKNGVKRQAFMAGMSIPEHEYYSVLATNAVINADDLPTAPKPKQKMETKVLDIPVIEKEVPAPEPEVVEPVIEPEPEQAVEPEVEPEPEIVADESEDADVIIEEEEPKVKRSYRKRSKKKSEE